MKLIYTNVLTMLLLVLAWNAQAQRVVNIPSDPTGVVDIYPHIMGDTTAAGDRVDNNTVYTLDNGGVYITTERLVNKKTWPLQIQAVDLANDSVKPIITRIPDQTGSYPKVAYPEGDMTLKNLWLITGERGPLEEHEWGQIRILGDSTTIRVEDCIIEKDRGGFLQLRANNVKCFVDNCILRNGGNRRILEGNGRGIDSRNFVFDSLVVTNSVIHNIVDRVFRSQGGTAPHGYIAFDNNTIFNVAGRHGCFQLRWVKSARITNNIMINPMMLGTTPALTDEQNQPDNGAHKIVTLDTVTAETELRISNNNLFWTQDVIDVWAMHDSVNRPDLLSMLVKQVMGDDTTNAFFEEVLSLNHVPQNITEYIEDLYANPAATDMFDFVVEDSSIQGTANDNGNLFDLANFDPCYDPASQSASAATHGGSIGYTLGCDGLTVPAEYGTSVEDLMNDRLALKAAPNPFAGYTNLTFNLDRSSVVRLTVFDITGRQATVLASGLYPAGEQEITWKPGPEHGAGIYFVRLETDHGFMTQKVILQ